MTAVDARHLSEAVRRLRDRIERAGGDPGAVRLVAATKGQPEPVVRAAVEAGLCDLGESHPRELADKAEALAAARLPGPVRWHCIGRLQTNKVRQIASVVDLWQSVDRAALATEVARRAPGAEVLVQVNVSGATQQGGCPPAEVRALVEGCGELGLQVRGLMAIGAHGPPEGARAGFRALRTLADDLGLVERSMGMSGDLEVAVAEGTTMVRVGRSLFGPRGGPPAVGK